jgi:hypothetical protein
MDAEIVARSFLRADQASGIEKMKKELIKVGMTYRSKGEGKTRRTVLAIGPEHRPREWDGVAPRPNEDGVLFKQNNEEKRLYLSKFASWCDRACLQVITDAPDAPDDSPDDDLGGIAVLFLFLFASCVAEKNEK